MNSAALAFTDSASDAASAGGQRHLPEHLGLNPSPTPPRLPLCATPAGTRPRIWGGGRCPA